MTGLSASASAALSLAVRLTLSGVFLIAGARKLFDRRAFGVVVSRFGVPQAIATAVAMFIPVAEVTLGALLLANRATAFASLGALILLVTFSCAVAVNLVQGKHPSCGCFGEASSKPISPSLLARNLGLAAMCMSLFLLGPRSTELALNGLQMPFQSTLVGATWSTALTFGLFLEFGFLVLLLRQYGEIRARLALLESAESRAQESRAVSRIPAPPFELSDAHGHTRRLEQLLTSGREVALLFVDPACESCGNLLADVRRWQTDLRERMLIVLVSKPWNSPTAGDKFSGLENVFFQQSHSVSELYGAHGTPAAAIIGRDGSLAVSTVFGRAAITQAILQAATDS